MPPAIVGFGSVVSHVGRNETLCPQRSFPWDLKVTFTESAFPIQEGGVRVAVHKAPTYSYTTDIEKIRGGREGFPVVGDARACIAVRGNPTRLWPGASVTPVTFQTISSRIVVLG